MHAITLPATSTPLASVTHLRTLEALEREADRGLVAQWRALAESDPVASVFQAPEWCLAWYRAYAPRFEPQVVLLLEDGALVALLPLAIERDTGRLAFAGDNMADYRDVVAIPSARARAATQLLDEFLDARNPRLIRIGYMQPESETPGLLREAARARGLHSIERAHACFRTWFTEPGIADKLARKESVRRNVNALKRVGELTLRRVASTAEWRDVRQTFFEHHSLRQLRAGRAISFTDPVKQDFYDRLFQECPDLVFAHVLEVGGRIAAGHVGCAWQGVAYFGAPAFDLVYERRSPGQVILSRILIDAQQRGMRGMDLTIGESTYKQRFGTEQVSLPSIEVYRSAIHWGRARVRDRVVAGAKQLMARVAKPGTWETLVSRFRGGGTPTPSAYERQLATEASAEHAKLLEVPHSDAPPPLVAQADHLAPILTLGDRQLQAAVLDAALVRMGRSERFVSVSADSRLVAWGFVRWLAPNTPSGLAVLHGVGWVNAPHAVQAVESLVTSVGVVARDGGATRVVMIEPPAFALPALPTPPDAAAIARRLREVTDQGADAPAPEGTAPSPPPATREKVT